ncbi:MAG: metallophosphoesterase [Thermodesulfobacteriota bacterium]
MKIAFTSDIHTDVSPENERVPEIQVPILLRESPDIFIVCGDVSADQRHFEGTLKKYGRLTCPKLVVAGNHDLWVENEEENSIEKYRYTLPKLAKENRFIYLGFEPYVTGNVGFVGTCGWYDYSFRNEGLNGEIPEHAYKTKKFGGRRWMDAVYCNWSSMEDAEVAGIMNESLKRQIVKVEDAVDHIVVVLHHVPFRELLTYKNDPSWDFLNAFTGNTKTAEIIRASSKVRVVLYGHTHERKEQTVDGILAMTHSVGYEWEWAERGMNPKDSVGFFHV